MIDFNHDVYFLPISAQNIEAMRIARNTPEVRRWCRQVGLISEIDQHEWFNDQNDDPTIRMFEVHNQGGEFVGVAGLTSIDWINKRAEFSLYILPSYQLRGLACKALKTLFSHGFKDLNLNLIWGETFDKNPAAKVFKKIGMVKEGTRRDFYFKGGEYISAHLYSIRGSEWTF